MFTVIQMDGMMSLLANIIQLGVTPQPEGGLSLHNYSIHLTVTDT